MAVVINLTRFHENCLSTFAQSCSQTDKQTPGKMWLHHLLIKCTIVIYCCTWYIHYIMSVHSDCCRVFALIRNYQMSVS